MKKLLIMCLMVLSAFIITAILQPYERESPRTIDFINLSDEYHVDNSEAVLYYPDGITPHIGVEAFLSTIEGAVRHDALDIESTDARVILTLKEHDMILDMEAQKIVMDRIEMTRAIGESPRTDFGAGVETIDTHTSGGGAVTIDLDSYDHQIKSEEGSMVIPLHLANLLFSGTTYNVHYNGDALHGVDVYQLNRESIQETLRESSYTYYPMDDAVGRTTRDFLLLLFEHFYGLDVPEGESSFESIIEDYERQLLASPLRHYEAIQHIVYALDDPHSSFLMGGMYAGRARFPLYRHMLGPRTLRLYEARERMETCEIEEGFTRLADDTARIVLQQFTLETPHRLKDALERAEREDMEHIIIDLTCNSGGVRGPMIRTLGMITDETIETHRKNARDGALTTHVYETDETYFPFEYSLLVSNVTYSAAHHFTVVAKAEGSATVYGERTGGGGASVATHILPSGAIIRLSSTDVLASIDGRMLEEGIVPDEPLQLESLNHEQLKEWIDDMD